MLTITFSIYLVLVNSKRDRLLKYDVLHPDNCFGLSSLGGLGVWTISPYLVSYLVILSILITHGTFYESVSLPLAGMTLLILAVSCAVLIPGYLLFKQAKREAFVDLLSRSHSDSGKSGPGASHFAIERICYGLTESSPYSTSTKLLVGAMNVVSLSGLSLSSLAQYFLSVLR
jgi:hypothetical protein